MDDEQLHMWGRALRESRAFLRRWSDAFTRDARDDLAQEAAFTALQLADRQRDPRSFSAFVRTISRRTRSRALKLVRREDSCVGEGEVGEWPAPEPAGAADFMVAGRWVPRQWLLARLEATLCALSPTNRLLLRSFYEGFSCSELGERFGISVDAVKVRLHRSRGVLRRRLECAVRAADGFQT